MWGQASVVFWKRSGTLALGMASALLAATANAQLEEIIVTAERKEADLQDVPVAVSAYNEVLLEKMQIQETLDLINLVPNLFGGNNTGLGTANMYYLRAQGNDESIATFDPHRSVRTSTKSTYRGRMRTTMRSSMSIASRFLRGPQGTLFGRNTTGGAVNMILKKAQ